MIRSQFLIAHSVERKTVIVCRYYLQKMKYNLITLLAIVLFTQVYGIVPKYIPKSKPHFKGRLLEITERFQPPEVSEDNFTIKKEKIGGTDEILDVASTKKVRMENMALEDDKRNNRLPEVNMKEVVDDAVNDDPDEDFVDLFTDGDDGDIAAACSEETTTTYKYVAKIRNKTPIRNEFNYKQSDMLELDENLSEPSKRVKRVIEGYHGRYKVQELNVLKAGTVSNSQTKSRLNRMSNIIEEENVVPTNAGAKFTGRATLLHHDLAFKNINS